MAKEALVVPRGDLVDHGFIPEHSKGEAAYYRFNGKEDLDMLLALAEQHGVYRERGGEHDVEKDASVQQLIVYGFIQKADGSFMLYQRGKAVDYDKAEGYHEARLAGKVSLGVGGHMERTDLSLMDAFYREFDEETVVTHPELDEETGEVVHRPVNFRRTDGTTDVEQMQRYVTVEPVGVIKDERDDVGLVHVGIACRLTPHDNVDIAIRAEGGENVRSFYVTTADYNAQVQSGEIEPEGWTGIVVAEELSRDSSARP